MWVRVNEIWRMLKRVRLLNFGQIRGSVDDITEQFEQ